MEAWLTLHGAQILVITAWLIIFLNISYIIYSYSESGKEYLEYTDADDIFTRIGHCVQITVFGCLALAFISLALVCIGAFIQYSYSVF